MVTTSAINHHQFANNSGTVSENMSSKPILSNPAFR